MKISGYELRDLSGYFEAVPTFTASSICQKLEDTRSRLATFEASRKSVTLSLGENCGAGVKLKEARIANFGSNFFDNLVCPIDSTIKLFHNDFNEFMRLKNLVISSWEDNDSVFETRYGIYFHHYFHLRGEFEKRRPDGSGRRYIDEGDISLFLSAVASQFEYLVEKLRFLLRSDVHKIIFFREVYGRVPETAKMAQLQAAMGSWGARNISLVTVCSGDHDLLSWPHIRIDEDNTRWGTADEWAAAADKASESAARFIW